jgi:hypothetical protein
MSDVKGTLHESEPVFRAKPSHTWRDIAQLPSF